MWRHNNNLKSPFIFFDYSQSVSNSWQTVADHIKTTQFTVKGLRPNTIYLFMVRAVNSQGLSDPSPMSDPVRTQGTLHEKIMLKEFIVLTVFIE